jgi:hypothetical protein
MLLAYVPILGLAFVPVALAALSVVAVMTQIYNAYREDPEKSMAEHLKSLEAENRMRVSVSLRAEESLHNFYRTTKSEIADDALSEASALRSGSKTGLDTMQPGMGFPGRQLPMVEAVAAKIGMDPADLMARLDPSRSNMYVPASRRGAGPRPTPQSLVKASAPLPAGPAQLNPMGGFGG